MIAALAIDLTSGAGPLRAEPEKAVPIGVMLLGLRTHWFLPSAPVSAFIPDLGVQYYLGDGLGMNCRLRILADGRDSSVLTGCLGIYERESGYATLDGNRLTLRPVVSSEATNPRTYFRVRWGPRSYLIESDQLKEYCDEIIIGREPRSSLRGFYYLDCVQTPVDGLPELPELGAAYLRQKFAVGRIIEVLKDDRVKIDLGSKDGVAVGEDLTIWYFGKFGSMWVTVTSVAETTCTADGPPGSGGAGKSLEVGKIVTARKRQGAPASP